MKETQVKINAKVIDSNARDQIKIMATSPAFKGFISIMPDVHLGIGAVIGFTGKFDNVVIPNVIGVDIGCGVTAYPLGDIEIDFEEFDKYVRKVIPLGFKSQENKGHLNDINPATKQYAKELCNKLCTDFYWKTGHKKYTHPTLQLGTLGGGNHFIEIGQNETGDKYLIIHSGSRNLGQKVAMYYQRKAVDFCKKSKISTPRHLEYLPLEYGGNEYMVDMKFAQEYARLNRQVMIEKLLNFFDIPFKPGSIIKSTHNFISEKDNVIRKGAISAHKGEQVIIPLNMATGTIIGVGKGNSSYNNSAPHGAGRVYGRRVMKDKLINKEVTMDQFKEKMKGIYSTSISEKTIDESPMAYKSYEDIEEYLKETVDILHILKPVYNLKSD